MFCSFVVESQMEKTTVLPICVLFYFVSVLFIYKNFKVRLKKSNQKLREKETTKKVTKVGFNRK